MGVYIKAMEMLTDKSVAVVIHPDGTAYTAEMVAGTCTEYLADCAAVPVPPHGRLVDADKLTEEMRLFIKENMLSRDDARELLETIADAPTIIPAEEGE